VKEFGTGYAGSAFVRAHARLDATPPRLYRGSRYTGQGRAGPRPWPATETGAVTDPKPQHLSVGSDGRRIAYLQESAARGEAPGVVWLCGLKSEMISTKATAVADWARSCGLTCLRFDYSGHGQSEGRFEDGTVSRWLEEAETVFRRLTYGPQILVGSSMGGYIALLLLRKLLTETRQSGVAVRQSEAAPATTPDARPPTAAEAARIKALVLIAPAWDMTELMWQRLSSSARKDIEETGVFLRPSRYGDGPYPITRALIDDGKRHLIGSAPFDPGRPVHIVHGLQDPDVPWEHTLDLVAHLSGDWTRVEAVPDGEHRLSRPQDIALLLDTIAGLAGGEAV
jgi:pimeloyl-ACP methyl ester carboxylesterase